MELSIPSAQQWLVHGSADEVVPPDFSREYVTAKLKRSGKKKEDAHLLEIAGAGHSDVIDPRTQAWKLVEETVLQIAWNGPLRH
jgi:pimeloyl-ACP methyl ester carboxylesterase